MNPLTIPLTDPQCDMIATANIGLRKRGDVHKRVQRIAQNLWEKWS